MAQPKGDKQKNRGCKLITGAYRKGALKQKKKKGAKQGLLVVFLAHNVYNIVLSVRLMSEILTFRG